MYSNKHFRQVGIIVKDYTAACHYPPGNAKGKELENKKEVMAIPDHSKSGFGIGLESAE